MRCACLKCESLVDYASIICFLCCSATGFAINRLTSKSTGLVVGLEAITQNVFITTVPNDVVMYRVILSDRYGA